MSVSVQLPRTEMVFGASIASTLGLRIEDGLGFEAWCEIGVKLSKFTNASSWWLADWLHFGEWEYGAKYAVAEQITGLANGTLRNLASVGGAVEMSRRRDKLSFGHHVEVAGLDAETQTAWLVRAEAEGLTREALREMIHGPRRLPGPRMDVRFQLAVPPDRAERWRAAADLAGVEFVEWAADVLDRAAA